MIAVLVDGPAWLALLLVAAGVVLAVAGAVGARLEWASYRYRVTDDAVEITHGVLVQTLSVLPHRRIQQIDVRRGPVERRLGLATPRAAQRRRHHRRHAPRAGRRGRRRPARRPARPRRTGRRRLMRAQPPFGSTPSRTVAAHGAVPPLEPRGGHRRPARAVRRRLPTRRRAHRAHLHRARRRRPRRQLVAAYRHLRARPPRGRRGDPAAHAAGRAVRAHPAGRPAQRHPPPRARRGVRAHRRRRRRRPGRPPRRAARAARALAAGVRPRAARRRARGEGVPAPAEADARRDCCWSSPPGACWSRA